MQSVRGPLWGDASSLPWLCYRLLYCGGIPEPPSPAAGRPSLQNLPLLADGTSPSEATYSSQGSQRAGRIMGEPGGTVSGRSTRQKDGKARHLDEAGGPEPAGQAACSGPGRISNLPRPPDSCWMKQGTAGLGTARQPPVRPPVLLSHESRHASSRKPEMGPSLERRTACPG